MNKLAQIKIGPLTGPGSIGQAGGDSPSLLAAVITSAIGLMVVVGFIWFLFQLFTGALGIIGSAGDKSKYIEARQRMITGVIGVVVLVSAFFIAGFIETILGINILDIGQAIDEITSPSL